MIEPEVAFIDLKQLMLLIEGFIKFVVNDVYKKCKLEIDQISATKTLIKTRFDQLIKKEFIYLEYTKAIDLLNKAKSEGINFEDSDFFFGKDLSSEHERYLCEKVYQAPVFLYNFPKAIKAFYMKVNDDEKTVAACDLLVPGVGEIVGGSQREDDYDKLKARCEQMHIDLNSIQWYLDLRRYGYYSSAGFGLGFERLLMYILDLDNIKDAIPFPRTEGNLRF
jgi:asparaginyl-tRNA synthetase